MGNQLKDMQDYAKKRQKGIGAFVNPNAGDVEKGNAMFNNATDVGSAPTSGGMGEDLESTDNMRGKKNMKSINIREELNKRDMSSCKTDFVNMYESANLSEEKKMQLVKLLSENVSNKKLMEWFDGNNPESNYTLYVLWAEDDRDIDYTEEESMPTLGDLIEYAETFIVPELDGGNVSHAFISDSNGDIVWDSNVELSYYAYGLKDKFGNVIAMFGKDKEMLNSKFNDFKKLVNLDSTDYELMDTEEYNDLVQSFWNLEIDLASDNSSLHDNIILGNDGKTLKIRDLNYNNIDACLLSPIEIVDANNAGIVNESKLNEWGLQKDEYEISDTELLAMGAERGSYGRVDYYVEKLYRPSETSAEWRVDFKKIYPSEELAHKAFERYKRKFSANKKDLKESKALNEGASNFSSLDKLPLLVFDVYDWVSDSDEDLSSDCVHLDEDTFEELKRDLDEFNDKTSEIADELYVDADQIYINIYNGNSTDEETDNKLYEKKYNEYEWLSDFKVVIKDGYYEAAQLYADTYDGELFDNISPENAKRIVDFFNEMKNKYNLTEIEVAYRFSNGETGYRVVDKKDLKENVEEDLPTEVTYDFYTLVDDGIDIESDDYNLDDVISDRLSDDYGYTHFGFNYDINKESGDVYVYDIKWDLSESLKEDVLDNRYNIKETEEDIFDILGIEPENYENSKHLLPQFRKLARKWDENSIWLKGDLGHYVNGKIVDETEDLVVVDENLKESHTNTNKEPLKQATFVIEDGPRYNGYDEEYSWNGWACPWFTKEEGLKIVDNLYGYLTFDETKDAFVMVNQDTTDSEYDYYVGDDIKTVDGTKHLYPIGNKSWIWDVVEEIDDIDDDMDDFYVVKKYDLD